MVRKSTDITDDMTSTLVCSIIYWHNPCLKKKKNRKQRKYRMINHLESLHIVVSNFTFFDAWSFEIFILICIIAFKETCDHITHPIIKHFYTFKTICEKNSASVSIILFYYARSFKALITSSEKV